MKIGILSDTHNNRVLVKRATSILKDLFVEAVVHCGDLTAPNLLEELAEFRLFYVYGNSDLDRSLLSKKLLQLNENNLSGLYLNLNLADKGVFIIHGDDYKKLENAINSAEYDYLLCGHTHQLRDEKIGKTRVINPGALGGRYREQRSFAVLDLSNDYLEQFYLD